LKLNLLNPERGELRGKGLQSRNDRSKILKKQKEVTINRCRTLSKKDSGAVRSRCIIKTERAYRFSRRRRRYNSSSRRHLLPFREGRSCRNLRC
jgi:hypothetical protein